MTLRPKILLIDDELHIRRLLRTALAKAGYETVEASGARVGMEKLRESRPDVTLLDPALPDCNGLELIPLIMAQSATTLIIISACNITNHKVTALDLGADDYLIKPIDTDEVLARVRVALRNRMTRDGGTIRIRVRDVEIDLISRTVLKGGRKQHLTPKEYAFLAQLARFPDRIITYAQIIKQVWPQGSEQNVDYLRVLVRALRQKLETDPQQPHFITNEPGIGYCLRSRDPSSEC